jgi:GNAT superfamily N-acetyltransferase
VRLTFSDARADDVEAIAALQNSVAEALTLRYGKGHWSSVSTAKAVAHSLKQARVRMGRSAGNLVTVLRLARKRPWAIDPSYFTPVRVPLYLTSMAVAVEHQRRGLGRLALEDAHAVAIAWPADAIRLDAYDADAGAGGFYERCGYTERGRVVYRRAPLIYYELLLR